MATFSPIYLYYFQFSKFQVSFGYHEWVSMYLLMSCLQIIYHTSNNSTHFCSSSRLVEVLSNLLSLQNFKYYAIQKSRFFLQFQISPRHSFKLRIRKVTKSFCSCRGNKHIIFFLLHFFCA